MSEADDLFEIGKRDGYEDAMQELDIATGGDGEYRYVMGDSASDRHCPTAAHMKQRIIDRFEAQQRALKFIAPSLLVLRNMCATIGLRLGEAKAKEMIDAVREVLCEPEAAPALDGEGRS